MGTQSQFEALDEKVSAEVAHNPLPQKHLFLLEYKQLAIEKSI
jgi:hypothetical protein